MPNESKNFQIKLHVKVNFIKLEHIIKESISLFLLQRHKTYLLFLNIVNNLFILSIMMIFSMFKVPLQNVGLAM
jgi:hypothetical protein